MKTGVLFSLKFLYSCVFPYPTHEFDEGSGRARVPCQHGKKGGLEACCVAGQGKGALGGVSALVVWCQRPQIGSHAAYPRDHGPHLAASLLAATDRDRDRDRTKDMSSLTGALESPFHKIDPTSADVDMHPSSFGDVTPELEPKQEDAMGDLFGEDSNVDFVHHSRLVPPTKPHLPVSLFVPFPQPIRVATNIKRQVHPARPSRDTLPPPPHHIRMTDFLPKIVNEDRLWNMKKKMNPMPSSSIASRPPSRSLIFHSQRVQTDKCVVCNRAHTNPHSPLFPFHSIGLFVCPISSKWTQNRSTQILTLDRNMRMTSWAAPTNATWVLNSAWRTQSGGVGLRTRMTKR